MKRYVRLTIAILLVLCLASCNEVPDGTAVLPERETAVSDNDAGSASAGQAGTQSDVSAGDVIPDVSGDENGTVDPATVTKPEASSLPDPFNGVGIFNVAASAYAEPAGSLNVKACGAVGDGVTDDFAAVTQAVALAGATGSVLYFPAGTYYLSQRLVLNQNITILGESMDTVVIMFKDAADYCPVEQYNQRGMATFVADSLDMKGVTFCYCAESFSGFTKQKDGSGGSEGVLFSVLKGSKINIHNCRFLIDGRNNPSVTCIWIKSEAYNISNIKISSCDIRNNSASTVGGGIWLSAHDSSDTYVDTVEICDSSLFKAGNDEIFATWGYHISNVSVHGNSMSYENHGTQNDVFITFGSTKEGRQECLKNVKFYNNAIMEKGLVSRVMAVQLLTSDSDVEISGNAIMCYPDASATVRIFRLTAPGSVTIKNNAVGVDGGSTVTYMVYSYGKVRFSGNLFKTRNTGISELVRMASGSFYSGVDLRFDKESFDLGAANATSGKEIVQVPVGGNVTFDSCSISTSASQIHETKVQLLYSDDSGYSYPSNNLTFSNCYLDTVLLIGFSKPSNTTLNLNGSYIAGISLYAEGSATGPASLEMVGTQYSALKYNQADVTPADISGFCTVVTK